jgi:hypothetical protein
MKVTQRIAVAALALAALTAGCASKPKVLVVEQENKGTSMGVETPDWIKTYTASGISAVQNQFKDKYCVIGEETGVNKQFVLAWADSFSAQQRIGAMLRTNIASKYQATVQGAAQSTGGADSSSAQGASSGEYSQQIDNAINSVVNVSYSGAQREADWWSLRRRYDPDQKDVYTDEYSAYVLYTIPKAELNRQIANALETSVSQDSALYAITIQLAREILTDGFEYIGAGDLAPAETPPQTQAEAKAVAAAGPSGKVVIRNSSGSTSSVLSQVKIFKGYEAKGQPFMTYDRPVLGGQQASWDLPEGSYTFEVFLNNSTESRKEAGYTSMGYVNSGSTTVGITADDNFVADFENGGLSSFTKK